MRRVEIIGLEGLGEVREGESIGQLIWSACSRQGISLEEGDILVVAHKIVSKAEGRVLALREVKPSGRAVELAAQLGKDPRLVEVILRESRKIVRMGGGTIIVETRQGLVCANAAVDLSNVGSGKVGLLPEDPDRSARRIREEIRSLALVSTGVIISDSFGRPWRLGTTDVAIGVCGLRPLIDYRGQTDPYGYELKGSVAAVADEIASAAELVMRKRDGVPVALVRGFEAGGDGSARELLRPEAQDLFRNF